MRGEFAVPVTVPEASVDKDRNLQGGKHQIRFAGKIPDVRLATTPFSSKQRSYDLLGRRIFAAYLRHIKAALRWRMNVWHLK